MKRQPKYSHYTPTQSAPRAPLNAKVLTEAHLRQIVAVLESRGAGVRELLDSQTWSLLVEAGRGFIEAGRVLLEEAVVRQAIDSFECGVYAPIEPIKRKDGAAT